MWGWSASSVGVERGGGGGYRVKGGLGVDRQAGHAGVPALGHQHREPDACFGEVGEPGVAELVLVIETVGTHWIVEVKMNKEMTSAEVQAKRDAAKR